MATLDARVKQLERSAPQPPRVAVLWPDRQGNHPKPPPGAVRVIRVEFVEVAHGNT